MKEYVLTSTTKQNIEKLVGVPYDELRAMTALEERSFVAKIASPKFIKARDMRKVGRGNPLLSRRRVRTFEDLDRYELAPEIK